MAKSLKTLTRVFEWEVDQKRRDLATKLASLDSLNLELKSLLQEADHKLNSEQIQQLVYDVGKEYSSEFTSLRDWFKALYEILLGQEQGPRIGSFISLYGVDETIKLIETILSKTKD